MSSHIGPLPKDIAEDSPWLLSDATVVCSRHFREADYVVGEKKKFLLKDAVPCLFPANLIPPIQKKRNLVSRKPSTKIVVPSEIISAREEVHEAPRPVVAPPPPKRRPVTTSSLPPESSPTSSSAASTPQLGSKNAGSLDRKKDRTRSKSPFRSFRFKKSPKSPTLSTHSDEGDMDVSDRPSPGGDDDVLETTLVRKHEWESTTKKASNRSWDKIYVVLRNNLLMFYKDQKTFKTTPDIYFKNEPPVDIRGGATEIAVDYTKKKHVFRVKLVGGAEFLFQARDDEEMTTWVSRVGLQTSQQGSAGPSSRSQTLPATGDRKDEPKRKGFFTLKKN